MNIPENIKTDSISVFKLSVLFALSVGGASVLADDVGARFLVCFGSLLLLLLFEQWMKNNTLHKKQYNEITSTHSIPSKNAGHKVSTDNTNDINNKRIETDDSIIQENTTLKEKVNDYMAQIQQSINQRKNIEIDLNNLKENYKNLEIEKDSLIQKLNNLQRSLNDKDQQITGLLVSIKDLEARQSLRIGTDTSYAPKNISIEIPVKTRNTDPKPHTRATNLIYASDPQNNTFHRLYGEFIKLETRYIIRPLSETEGEFELVDDPETRDVAFMYVDSLKDACELFGTDRPHKVRYRNGEKGKVRKEGDFWVITKKLPLEWD
jgi:hypothetical protein